MKVLHSPLGKGRLLGWVALSFAFSVLSCGGIERQSPHELQGQGAADVGRLRVFSLEAKAPPSSDATPLFSVAVESSDGALRELPTAYVDAVAFRTDVAGTTPRGELELIHVDGSRSRLAAQIEGLPTSTKEALLYAAKFGSTVEVHWLTAEGIIFAWLHLRGAPVVWLYGGDDRCFLLELARAVSLVSGLLGLGARGVSPIVTFGSVKPGETDSFRFPAKRPRLFR